MARSETRLERVPGVQRRALPALPEWLVAAVGMAVFVGGLSSGCGRAGAPIPPEDLGVPAKLERERQAELRHEQAGAVPGEVGVEAPEPGKPGKPGMITPGEEVVLPPLRPVDTR